MRSYGLQGTPSTLLIDRFGRLRLSAFGVVDDLRLGAQLGQLVAEPSGSDASVAVPTCQVDRGCS